MDETLNEVESVWQLLAKLDHDLALQPFTGLFLFCLRLTNLLSLIVTLLLQATVEYDLALQPFKRPQDEEYLKVNLVAIFLQKSAEVQG